MAQLNTSVVTASASRLAGGLFSSVRRLHQTLSQDHGVNVHVFACHDQYSDADQALWKPLRIDTFPVSGPRQLGYSPPLKRAILDAHTDIGHTHGLWVYSSVAISDWHRKTGRPYVISPHGMLDPWAIQNSGWKKQLALLFYEYDHLKKAACLRALCQSEAESIRDFGLKNPICVIPNGVDLPARAISDPPPWKDSLAAGQKVLLFLSRIHPKKGLVNLLHAWAKLLRSESGKPDANEWVLAVAGWDQGTHEQQLKDLATELGLTWADIRAPRPGSPAAYSVLFLGPQFDAGKDACYAHCDAFILPSFSEGLPMVALESWAHSKPILMTPECNLPEGFLAGAAIEVQPAPDSLLAGLRKLRSMTAAERAQMGKCGHELVLKRFTWTQVANQMQVVQLWILGSGPKPDCLYDR